MSLCIIICLLSSDPSHVIMPHHSTLLLFALPSHWPADSHYNWGTSGEPLHYNLSSLLQPISHYNASLWHSSALCSPLLLVNRSHIITALVTPLLLANQSRTIMSHCFFFSPSLSSVPYTLYPGKSQKYNLSTLNISSHHLLLFLPCHWSADLAL